MEGDFKIDQLRTDSENVWASSYPFLLDKGYKLRPRYSPNWVPSWGLKNPFPTREDGHREDAIYNLKGAAIDAIQITTGQKVAIKRGSIEEASTAMYLHSLESSQGENRTVPIIDIFHSPGTDGEVFIVMPMLREFGGLPFRRVGEFVEAMQQFLKGLVFMHKHNVAHRDACFRNLCMDATRMIPKGYHFVRDNTHDGNRIGKFHWRARSAVGPIHYFFIDFGLSSRYPPEQESILDYGIVGQDKTVPEMSLKIPYDPFKMDVYQLGNAFKRVAQARKYEGLEWVVPLLDSMTHQDPKNRPSAAQALSTFDNLTAPFRKKDLKKRIWFKSTTNPHFRFEIRYLGYNPHWI